MKTSQGKLAALAFVLLLAAVLFLPMRAGQEDELLLEPQLLRMSVGDSYAVRCSLSAEKTDQRLTFTCSDERVARIDRDGTVHALSSGEAVIRAAASGGASAQMRVEVAGVPLRELQLNVDEVHIEKGEYSGLSVQYNDDASDTRLKWISSNERVVRVDDSGKLEGVGGGEAYVSAISPSGRSATAKVFVKVAGTAVHISPNQLTLGVGARVPLKASFLPLDSTDSVRRWSSSNPNVLTVGADGALEAVGQGSAYVTVLSEDGLTAGMEVVVEAGPTDLQLNPSRATLERGDELQMQLLLLEEDGSVRENEKHPVEWSSSDPSVASVDENGYVRALKSGTCRIEASADGRTASCRMNVQVTIQEIQLARNEMDLLREDTEKAIQLRLKYSPEDPDDPTITFTSDNEQVATVDENGLVRLTGGYGTVVISATAVGGARDELTINVVTELPEEATAEPTAEEATAEPTEAPTQASTEAPAAIPAATTAPMAEPAATPVPAAAPVAAATVDSSEVIVWE